MVATSSPTTSGEPARPGVPTVVLMSTMHGNEPHTRQILFGFKDGRPSAASTCGSSRRTTPTGWPAGARKNAHGVDLNRNFPYSWKDLDGSYESGPEPASEPETKAMMRFLRKVRPDYILSFHQPLHGVDTDSKRPKFARQVANRLHLPAKSLDCGSVCHGTMTMWFNHRFRGVALTVEYGAHPPKKLPAPHGARAGAVAVPGRRLRHDHLRACRLRLLTVVPACLPL